MSAYYPADWSATMRTALVTWAAGVLGAGWTVVWPHQNAPAPARPFARLQAVGLPVTVGRTTEEALDVDEDQMDVLVRSAAEFTVEVQLFAKADARAELSALRMDLERGATRETLREAGLVPHEILTPRDLTAFFAGEAEHRHLLEVRMGVEERRHYEDQPFIQTPAVELEVS